LHQKKKLKEKEINLQYDIQKKKKINIKL